MSAIEQKVHEASSDAAVSIVTVVLSYGGLEPLRHLISGLAAGLPTAIVIAQHAHHTSLLPQILSRDTTMPVTLAASGMLLRQSHVYVCPGAHHVIVNPDATLTISNRARLKYVRPNGDWLFESAAASFREQTFAVVLSGLQCDGARGTMAVRNAGGTVIVQTPETCERPDMPLAAISMGTVHHVLPPAYIARLLNALLANLDTPALEALQSDPFGSALSA
jgi:two-component system, chemotaxis family, protein-glutamate methylesterase/glutaminase